LSFGFDKRNGISVLIVFVFNIILINLPLTSVFGYEFSAFNSIILVIISGLLSVSHLKRKGSPVKNLISISPYLILIPLIISVVNSLFTTTCSLGDGFLFYLIITIPSLIIGTALGMFAFFIFPRFPVLLFLFLLLLMGIIPIAEIYYYPQIYFFNPLIGFFPGTIYDEGLSVSYKLVIYRLINCTFFTALFITVWLLLNKRLRIKRFLFASVVLMIVSIFIVLSPLIGFSTNKSRVESSLKGKCYTEHFEIIYDSSIDTSFLKNIIVHHELYYFELKKYFQDEPHGRIVSFVFRNNKQKGELFGSENADVAKPWLNQIYITAFNYDVSLKHEIAHIFSSTFGSGPFRISGNYNPALVEGIAEAASPFYSTLYIDQIASIAWNNNYKFKIDKLFSGFNFFGQASSLSYVYAGAFTNFLIKTYGIEKFKEYYRGESFSRTYGSNMTAISGIFYRYLDELGLSNKPNTAQYFFGMNSIFSKFCPRYIADRLEKGWGFYYEGNYSESEKIFANLNNITQSYSALYGLVLTKVKMKKDKDALGLLTVELPKYKNTSYYYGLELLLGDIFARTGNFSEAKGYYFDLNSQYPDIHFEYLSRLRLNLAISDSLIYRYITGEDSAKYQILRKYNTDSYDYSSFPVLLGLAESLHKPYKEVIKLFDGNIVVNDLYSSYGVYALSKYMMENLDYTRARKLAALATQFTNEDGINLFLRSHFIRAEWVYFNQKRILKYTRFVQN
jgi:hypothetical protein